MAELTFFPKGYGLLKKKGWLPGMSQAESGASGGGGGSSVPDYASILAADPYYSQFQKTSAAEGVQDKASRDAARQRAIVMFGESPDFSSIYGALGLIGGDFGSTITPAIKQLAEQNTAAKLSTVARMAQADIEARRGIGNTLGSRGTYNSGELGYQMGREQTDYLRSQYDARQNLVDFLAGVQGSYLQSERARQMALAQEALAAFLRGQYGGDGGGGGGGSSGGGGGGGPYYGGQGTLTGSTTLRGRQWTLPKRTGGPGNLRPM